MAAAKTPDGRGEGPAVVAKGLGRGQLVLQMLCWPGGSLSCCWGVSWL